MIETDEDLEKLKESYGKLINQDTSFRSESDEDIEEWTVNEIITCSVYSLSYSLTVDVLSG